MQLASGCFIFRSVWLPIDHHATRTANPFAAIMVEGHRFFMPGDQLLVQYIQHFQKRHVTGYVFQMVRLKGTLHLGRRLSPDMQRDFHDVLPVRSNV